MKHLDIKQIQEFIPHRHPFLLLDYVEDYEPGEYAVAGAVAILSEPENQGKVAYFGGIDKCKFKGKVVPGDKLRLETRIIRKKGPIGVGEAVATVDGKKVVSAVLTFAVG